MNVNRCLTDDILLRSLRPHDLNTHETLPPQIPKNRVEILRKRNEQFNVLRRHKARLKEWLEIPLRFQTVFNTCDVEAMGAFHQQLSTEDLSFKRELKKLVNISSDRMYLSNIASSHDHGRDLIVEQYGRDISMAPDCTMQLTSPIITVSENNELVITANLKLDCTLLYTPKDQYARKVSVDVASSPLSDETTDSRKRKHSVSDDNSSSLCTSSPSDQSQSVTFTVQELSMHKDLHRLMSENNKKICTVLDTRQLGQSSIATADDGGGQSATNTSIYRYVGAQMSSFVSYVTAPLKMIRIPSLKGTGKKRFILDKHLDKIIRMEVSASVELTWSNS